MTEQKKEGDCCSSSSSEGSRGGCCGGKKFIFGILVGLVLTAAAFGFYSVGQCAAGKGKICPVTGASMEQVHQMQK